MRTFASYFFFYFYFFYFSNEVKREFAYAYVNKENKNEMIYKVPLRWSGTFYSYTKDEEDSNIRSSGLVSRHCSP